MCHLDLLHQGLIRIEGAAPAALHWEIGRPAVVVVEGRRRVRAA
jgi:hypothetical protein